jgi:hypothetical protein
LLPPLAAAAPLLDVCLLALSAGDANDHTPLAVLGGAVIVSVIVCNARDNAGVIGRISYVCANAL